MQPITQREYFLKEVPKTSTITLDSITAVSMSVGLVSVVRNFSQVVISTASSVYRGLGNSRLISAFWIPFAVSNVISGMKGIYKKESNHTVRFERVLFTLSGVGELFDSVGSTAYGIALIGGAVSASSWMAGLFGVGTILQWASIARESFLMVRTYRFQKELADIQAELLGDQSVEVRRKFLLEKLIEKKGQDEFLDEYLMLSSVESVRAIALEAVALFDVAAGEEDQNLKESLEKEANDRVNDLLNSLKERVSTRIKNGKLRILISTISLVTGSILLFTPAGILAWSVLGACTLSGIGLALWLKSQSQKPIGKQAPRAYFQGDEDRTKLPDWQKNLIQKK